MSYKDYLTASDDISLNNFRSLKILNILSFKYFADNISYLVINN